MNPDLQALRDIQDGLGNPWWPPGPGWWLGLLLLASLGLLLHRSPRLWRLLRPLPLLVLGDWRWDAHRALRRLRRIGASQSFKSQTAALSELLKRVAMARQGRVSCAGLQGQRWLDWLTEHDPDQFDWRTEGQLLIHAPYAPEGPGPIDQAHAEQLRRLMDATERWIGARPIPAPDRADRQVGARRFSADWIGTRWAAAKRAGGAWLSARRTSVTSVGLGRSATAANGRSGTDDGAAATEPSGAEPGHRPAARADRGSAQPSGRADRAQ